MYFSFEFLNTFTMIAFKSLFLKLTSGPYQMLGRVSIDCFFPLSKDKIFLSMSSNFLLHIRHCHIGFIPTKTIDFCSSRQFNFRLIILNLDRPRFIPS